MNELSKYFNTDVKLIPPSEYSKYKGMTTFGFIAYDSNIEFSPPYAFTYFRYMKIKHPIHLDQKAIIGQIYFKHSTRISTLKKLFGSLHLVGHVPKLSLLDGYFHAAEKVTEEEIKEYGIHPHNGCKDLEYLKSIGYNYPGGMEDLNVVLNMKTGVELELHAINVLVAAGYTYEGILVTRPEEARKWKDYIIAKIKLKNKEVEYYDISEYRSFSGVPLELNRKNIQSKEFSKPIDHDYYDFVSQIQLSTIDSKTTIIPVKINSYESLLALLKKYKIENFNEIERTEIYIKLNKYINLFNDGTIPKLPSKFIHLLILLHHQDKRFSQSTFKLPRDSDIKKILESLGAEFRKLNMRFRGKFIAEIKKFINDNEIFEKIYFESSSDMTINALSSTSENNLAFSVLKFSTSEEKHQSTSNEDTLNNYKDIDTNSTEAKRIIKTNVEINKENSTAKDIIYSKKKVERITPSNNSFSCAQPRLSDVLESDLSCNNEKKCVINLSSKISDKDLQNILDSENNMTIEGNVTKLKNKDINNETSKKIKNTSDSGFESVNTSELERSNSSNK